MTWEPYRPPRSEDDATPIAASLAKVIRKLGAASPKTTASVFEQWESVVGPAIAGHVEPQSLVDGVLVVAADHPQWANQIKWMANQLVDRLNEATNAQEIQRLEVRLKRPNSAK